MAIFRCPQNLFDLCNNERSAQEVGRRAVIEWMKEQMDEIQIGDTVIIPGEHGEEVEWEKTEGTS